MSRKKKAPEPKRGPLNSKRISYLENAYVRIAEDLRKAGAPAPKVDQVHITVGWPSKRATVARNRRIGECWANVLAGGQVQVTVSPAACGNRVQAIGTLLHEAIHAATPGHGHKGEFKRLAKAFGLEGPMRSTTAGPEAVKRIEGWCKGLGVWPAEDVDSKLLNKRRVGSRLRLWECSCDPPVKVRVASDDFQATCDRCHDGFECKQGAGVARPHTGGGPSACGEAS